MIFAQLAVNVPSVAGVFDYAVPEGLEAAVGQLVTAPFGGRTVQGVILRFVEKPAVRDVKPILSALDPEPVVSATQIAFAESLADATLMPVAAFIEMMLPPGLSQQADTRFDLRAEQHEPGSDHLSSTGLRLVRLLRERGALRGRQIDRHFGRIEWRGEARRLVRQGLLSSQPVLPTTAMHPKLVRTAQLAIAPEAAEAAMPLLGRARATLERRKAALQYLVRAKEAVNVSWVYAESGCSLKDLQELAERDLIILRETEIWRDPVQKIQPLEEIRPTLTAEQQAAWEQIRDGFAGLRQGKPLKPFLLQGVTGSGKTELYARAVEEAARQGRQSIVLVPEIALTPQTVRRFLARFPGQVGLVHSKLSEGERYDTWRRARVGLLKVVIGPRSALFAPLPNLGLIVVDECHDGSYHQSEPPFYHAAGAAQVYAGLAGAACILGSATPSVVQRHEGGTGATVRLELTTRIAAVPRREPASNGSAAGAEAGLPPVSIVDMRDELKAGNRSMFSRELMDALKTTLGRNEQAILFLNRRGTATYVFCRECGGVLKCPRCETPLTLHLDEREGLRCHHCGYQRNRPRTCPACNSPQIREYGLGSERVEAEVARLFPAARTLRWDWETTRQKEAHEIILSHFAGHKADVLVGTQMLAKGLDLPLVTLVGIVLADVGLNLPDPFAGERVFQVLTQVAGRAGRSARGGQVILQTFQPGSQVIQSAAQHDYEGFYKLELAQRKRLQYPPFARLARLEVRDEDPARAEKEARALAGRLERWIESEGRKATSLIGPVPAFFSKLGGSYRWQVVVRGPDPVSLLRGRVPPNVRLEVDPVSLL
ncbi:MAG: primosomal protein N' [Bacteroidota bacterium]